MDEGTGTRPTGRDRSLLRAIAAGRCELSYRCGPVLTIDGGYCCDQLAARRLIRAGLVAAPVGTERERARLTSVGNALLPVA